MPVYEQVKQNMKLAIISGYLQQADQVMSIRELAARLKIHPNTIAKIYYQLEVEGFLYSKPGTGYFVKVDHRKIQREKQDLFKKVTRDYVTKTMNLGYSLTDMIVELQGMDMENPIEKIKERRKK
ncbi:GntR family transcriptional regulator [Acidobacteriota bacterium]